MACTIRKTPRARSAELAKSSDGNSDTIRAANVQRLGERAGDGKQEEEKQHLHGQATCPGPACEDDTEAEGRGDGLAAASAATDCQLAGSRCHGPLLELAVRSNRSGITTRWI